MMIKSALHRNHVEISGTSSARPDELSLQKVLCYCFCSAHWLLSHGNRPSQLLRFNSLRLLSRWAHSLQDFAWRTYPSTCSTHVEDAGRLRASRNRLHARWRHILFTISTELMSRLCTPVRYGVFRDGLYVYFILSCISITTRGESRDMSRDRQSTSKSTVW